ncbi:proline racemase family protein [Haloarculaceae archaeon H-GB2-1]|nr:proline racemase family protein [Haloarculaceae archaeon H-GB11]MEA5406206.1 proline racemase family protein [Haloarculaceae archaeon H-GB2-1]
MHSEVSFETIDTHTAGEPTRIVLEGIDESMTGSGSVREMRDEFAAESDWVRRLLMQEPRGHANMFGAVIVDAEADADVGAFFMDSGGYQDMCGHGVIGITTALVEEGMVDASDEVTIETPSGVVTAHPTVEDGRVESVTMRNVPSFVFTEVELDVDVGAGRTRTVDVDVVYSGNFTALVDASQFDAPIGEEDADVYREYGRQIWETLDAEYEFVHPFHGESYPASVIEFYETGAVDQNVVVFGAGAQIDRSPCGSGTCAKATYLYDRGTWHSASRIPTRASSRRASRLESPTPTRATSTSSRSRR